MIGFGQDLVSVLEISLLVFRTDLDLNIRLETSGGEELSTAKPDQRGRNPQTLPIFERKFLANGGFARGIGTENQPHVGLAQNGRKSLSRAAGLLIDQNGEREREGVGFGCGFSQPFPPIEQRFFRG